MIEPSASSFARSPDFGFHAPPFAECVDDVFFFPSDQHLRALEFMGHSVWTNARLGVVTAEHGCGKSLLIRRFMRDLDERIVAAVVQREHMGPRGFLLEVLRQFGLPVDEDDKVDRRRLLERFVMHQATLGRVCLLILENPQSMSPAVLEELRCLAALQADGARILKLLLLGQPSLKLVLESPRMSELGAARAPRFTLSALTEDQTAAYVAHRLRAAGAVDADALMPCALMPEIHACSGGAPAQINRLCERALAIAADKALGAVDADTLEQAIDALNLTQRRMRTAAALSSRSVASNAERAKLVISMQGMPDREVMLRDRMLIGRGDEADVRIDSVFVSRFHALIVRNTGQDLMIDLGSTNGLIVNSRRIVRRALRHRDLIQVGPARVMYFNEQLAAAAQPDPGETICFARPGLPPAEGESSGALLPFGRLDAVG